MEGSIHKTPGTYEEISITCPKCSSSKVTISVDEKGYFKVLECSKCDYKKEE